MAGQDLVTGGENTGIPRGSAIAEPYGSMSFVPTLLRTVGRVERKNHPNEDLRRRGFRQFSGRVVRELTDPSGK